MIDVYGILRIQHMFKIDYLIQFKWFTLLFLHMLDVNNAVAADEVLVFVGEYIKVEERPYSDEYRAECNCIIMDSRYRAEYKVKQILYGEYSKEEITFFAFDHYGYPNFAKQKTAIIYLRKDEYNYVHLKYEWDSVTPVKNGGYAKCEDTTLFDEEHNIKIKDFNFDPPIQVDLSHSTEYVINDYKEDPLYIIEGDSAVCVKGISAKNVFKQRWPEVIEDNKLDLES